MDLNMLYGYSVDGDGWTIEKRIKEIDEGKFIDPRDPKATEQTRREFRERMRRRRSTGTLPSCWDGSGVRTGCSPFIPYVCTTGSNPGTGRCI